MNPQAIPQEVNMDIVCTTVADVQTCVDPWNYYKASVVDIVLVFVVAYLVVKILK